MSGVSHARDGARFYLKRATPADAVAYPGEGLMMTQSEMFAEEAFAPTAPIEVVRPLSFMEVGPSKAKTLLGLYHYKRSMPGTTEHCFAMFDGGGRIIGACLFGQPATPQVAVSVAAESHRKVVVELTRLVLDGRLTKRSGLASQLVGFALRSLPRPRIVVSYADSAEGHVGIVYRATNFRYFGTSVSHDSLYDVPGEGLVHPRTLHHRGINDPTRWAKEHGYATVPPKPKHRYVYAVGSRTQRKHIWRAVQWSEVFPT